MGIKNVFKWRVTANKYLYLVDEDNKAPFILDKKTGIRIYPQPISGGNVTGTTVISGMTLDEGLISQTVSNIKNANIYSEKYNRMVELASFDSDASKLTFLDYDNYFNLNGDECVEEAVTPKCEGYEPVFNVSAYTLENSGETEVEYSFYAERNESDKTLRYNLDLGIPRGEKGEKGDDGVGCKGDKGDDGLDAIITDIEANVTAIEPDEEATVSVVSSKTENNEYQINFNFNIPRGEQGTEGPVGDNGEPGWDAVVTNVSATATELAPGSTPYAVISESSITINENAQTKTNETSFRIDFGLPTGLQGVQGNNGLNAEIRNVSASVETLPPGAWFPDEYAENKTWVRSEADASVEITPAGGGNIVDLHFNFKIPRGDKGEQGDPGQGGSSGSSINYDFDNVIVKTTTGSTPYFELYEVPSVYDNTIRVWLEFYYPVSWGNGSGANREIKINGNNFLGNDTTTLNIVEGSNITLTGDVSAGTLTISSTGGGSVDATNDNTNKLYLVGAKAQTTNPETKSNSEVYETGGKLHADRFEVGTSTAEGINSVAEGYLTTAHGNYSHAEGAGGYVRVSGEFTWNSGETTVTCRTSIPNTYFLIVPGMKVKFPNSSEIKQVTSTTVNEGLYTTYVTAFEVDSVITSPTHSSGPNGLDFYLGVSCGVTSHSEGGHTIADGGYSHSEGSYTISKGDCSHAEGYLTTAHGNYSHAEGNKTTAKAYASHAEGSSTFSDGAYSHAEGITTRTDGAYSHSEGAITIAKGYASHAEGQGGNESVNGEFTWNSGETTVTCGTSIPLLKLIKPGMYVIFPNNDIKQIVDVTVDTATSIYVSAFTVDSEFTNTHSAGTVDLDFYFGVSIGVGSHSEGYKTIAYGDYSHAEGSGTFADNNYLTVVGKYNQIGDTSALFIVGNGNTINNRSNAFLVNDSGNCYASGAYYASSDARNKNIVNEISLDKAYELVDKCQTILYTWKNDEDKQIQIGLLAQEVQVYFPELVSKRSDGYLTLDYSKLTVVLLRVIRDLTHKMKSIEDRLKSLEDKLK